MCFQMKGKEMQRGVMGRKVDKKLPSAFKHEQKKNNQQGGKRG